MIKQCKKCNLDFNCGFSSKDQDCWCLEFSPLLKMDSELACVCESCLKKNAVKEITQLIKDYKSSGSKIDLTKYQTKKLTEGIDFYSENGLMVFSSWYHLKRGTCCGNGCRHCPY